MIRIAVVDDHPLYRHGLDTLVAAAGDMELAVSVSSVEELDAAAVPADLVLLDLGMPGLSGAGAVAHIRARGLTVLVISASSQRDDVLDAIAAGAAGYVSKSADATEVAAAIRTAVGGGIHVSPTLAAYLLQDARGRADESALSEREREILELVAEGETDKDIARQLRISPATVSSHLDRIRGKTGRRRRADLTRYAYERGIKRVDSPEG